MYCDISIQIFKKQVFALCSFSVVNKTPLLSVFVWLSSPSGPMRNSYRGLEISLKHTTLSRTPLDEWSACHRDLHLTRNNTQYGQTSLPPAVFEPVIQASERPKTHTLDRAATGVGPPSHSLTKIQTEIYRYQLTEM
jgi:hypothetical protein